MPIDTKHPQYSEKKADLTTDAYKGEVLDYIPRLKSQTNEDYRAYRDRGVYYNVVKPTVEACVGSILRKPYVTNEPDPYIDGNLSLDNFSGQIIRCVLNQGRTGILADYSETKNTPYLCYYERGNIINWYEYDDKLECVVLYETCYEPDPNDKYTLVLVERYRELYMTGVPGEEQRRYQVRVWQKDSQNNFKVIEEREPTYRSIPFDHIPFVFVNPFDTSLASYSPVMYTLAMISLAHFKNSVDQEYGLHKLALPTPWFTGDLQEDTSEIVMGGERFIGFEQGSTVGMLEFSGQGLKSIDDAMKHKEELMAATGAKLLTSKKGVESSESLRIRSASESASLINVATAVEDGLQQALTHYRMWNGTTEEATFEFDKDFTSIRLEPQDVQVLLSSLIAGKISQDTFLRNLYEGEIVDNVDEEKKRLEQNNQDNPQINT